MPKVKANNIELYYQETKGQKETIVFAHGYLMNNSMFDGQIKALKKHFNCIAYDHRGHGQSDAPQNGYELQNLTNDAIALIESLGSKPVHFVGMSTGGFIGMRIALQRPELLKSLVLMDTSAERDSPSTLRQNYLLLWVVKYIGWFPAIRQVMALLFHSTFLKDKSRSAEQKKWKDTVTKQDKRGLILFGKGIFARKAILEQLPQIKIPTLVLVGECDKATPPAYSQRMADKIDDSILTIIPDSGHSCAVEKPQLVADAMLDFYKQKGLLSE